MIGLCLSVDESAPDNLFFVLELDVKYGARVKLYNVKRGTSGVVRIQKRLLEQYPFEAGRCLYIDAGSNRPKSVFQNGKRVSLPNEREYWMTCYHIAR